MALWAVDLHVHLYSGFNIDLAVDSAWKNVRSGCKQLPFGQCWCLASPPGIDGLNDLAVMADVQSSNTKVTTVRDVQGRAMVILENKDGEIAVVPGTQAISAEGLEVLSLAAELPDTDSAGLEALVDLVRKKGGVPVIPWGVGKWLGRRGQLVARVVRNSKIDAPLLFADNANRPWWWPYPRLLRSAARRGLVVVSGSDPLPIKGDETRISSAGITCEVSSAKTAWQDIRRSLFEATGTPVTVFGLPMSNLKFWHHQLLLRLRSEAP